MEVYLLLEEEECNDRLHYRVLGIFSSPDKAKTHYDQWNAGNLRP